MKKVLSIIILLVICCYSCSVFAVSYNITTVKDSAILEKVTDDDQGVVENKITKVDTANSEIYGEVNFTNTIYENNEKKNITEIYIMVSENIVNDSSKYETYIKYIEEFANKVYTKNPNTKIGIVGIKGTIRSYTEKNGNLILDDDDQSDIPGSANNTEIVVALTNDIQTLKKGLSNMNTKKESYYVNLQAAIGLARRSYSSGTNRILISLFDNVPSICNGTYSGIQRSEDDDFAKLVKEHNDTVVNETKKEMLTLKNTNVSFILLRPDDTSYDQKWFNAETGETILDYDGSQHVKDLYGTLETPTYGKMYSLSSDSLEKIVTQYIYEDVISKLETTIKNTKIQITFTKEVYDNFNITSLSENSKNIDTSKISSEGKVVWKIDELKENEKVSFKYKLKLKDSNISENILDNIIKVSAISISLEGKSDDIEIKESPTITISLKQSSDGNGDSNSDNNDNDANNGSSSNASKNSSTNSNLKNDPTIAKENFPKAGKIIVAFALISLIGCASIGVVKMINLKDVK